RVGQLANRSGEGRAPADVPGRVHDWICRHRSACDDLSQPWRIVRRRDVSAGVRRRPDLVAYRPGEGERAFGDGAGAAGRVHFEAARGGRVASLRRGESAARHPRARAANGRRQLRADVDAVPGRRNGYDARGAGCVSASRAIAAPAARPGIQRARSGGGDQPAFRPYPMRKRAIFAAAIAAALMTSCGGAKKSDDEGAAPSNPMLLVSAARAEVHPMTSELRLLGKTVATRHVIIRAPAAGRVTEMKLISGDSVRKGQIVAYVINREIEAAEAGLAVARKIAPQDAAGLSASVGRYNHGAGIPVVAPESGIVSQPPVTSGQMVADLDTLVDLTDPQSLYVDVSLPLSELSLVRPGMAATVTTPFRPGVEFPARVAALMPNFDTTSATSSVRTDFTGPERIAAAGAPVEVRIETSSVPDAIV